MKTVMNKQGIKTLQSFTSWNTDNERETVLEFDPMLLAIHNCLHIRSTHMGANRKRKRSYFIHVLALSDVVTLRNFLNDVLANAEHKLRIKARHGKN